MFSVLAIPIFAVPPSRASKPNAIPLLPLKENLEEKEKWKRIQRGGGGDLCHHGSNFIFFIHGCILILIGAPA